METLVTFSETEELEFWLNFVRNDFRLVVIASPSTPVVHCFLVLDSGKSDLSKVAVSWRAFLQNISNSCKSEDKEPGLRPYSRLNISSNPLSFSQSWIPNYPMITPTITYSIAFFLKKLNIFYVVKT